jgi:hypothetical protein
MWPRPLLPRIRARPLHTSIDLPPRRTLSASRGSQPGGNDDLNPSAANRHRNKSTGISYLDTWMGNRTNGERRPMPPASEPMQTRPDIRNLPPPLTGNTHFPNVAATYTSSNFVQCRHLPSATYQMFSLRPTKTDTPETLLERLKGQVEEANVNATTSSSVIPLVLDLSAFHPDGSPHSPTVAGVGSLTKVVEAIQSYREEGNSTASGPSYLLVGVANLPHHDTSMADEVRSMKLPVFCIGRNSDGASKSVTNPASSKREKRGVAPLLRQRRPGVAATHKQVDDDSSTLTTRDDASTESSPGIHVVGMGALAPRDQAHNSTKLHRGSIRSGQLLTSDR